MAFAANGKLLIAVGGASEGSLCVFNVNEGSVIKSTLIRSHAVNKVVVDTNLDEGEGVEFITIGSKGTFTMWKLDTVEDIGIELVFSAVTMKEELKECDFVTATYTPPILTLGGQSIILLGTA